MAHAFWSQDTGNCATLCSSSQSSTEAKTWSRHIATLSGTVGVPLALQWHAHGAPVPRQCTSCAHRCPIAAAAFCQQRDASEPTVLHRCNINASQVVRHPPMSLAGAPLWQHGGTVVPSAAHSGVCPAPGLPRPTHTGGCLQSPPPEAGPPAAPIHRLAHASVGIVPVVLPCDTAVAPVTHTNR